MKQQEVRFKYKAGFTLSEMVVASLLAVLVVAGTYSVATHSFRLLRAASNRTAALGSAGSVMEYLLTCSLNDDILAVNKSKEYHGSPFSDLEFKDIHYTVSTVESNKLFILKQIVVKAPWNNVVTGKVSTNELTVMMGSSLHE